MVIRFFWYYQANACDLERGESITAMNKKEENRPLSEGAVVSNSFRYSIRSKFLPKSRRGKLLAYGLILGCVLIITGLVVLSMKSRKDTEIRILNVGKYSYSQAEYNKRIEQAKTLKISEFDARKALREAFAARQAADDLKISYPTDTQTLNFEAARVYKLDYQSTSVNDYQRDTTYTSLIKPFVSFGVQGGYRVGYLEFPFSRYIVAGDNSQFHNIALINQDIEYSKSQAEQSRELLVKKKKSISEIADKVRADTRLTYGQAGNMSEEFFADEAGNMYSSRFSGNMVQSWLFKAIKEAEVGKVSDIKTKSWSNDTGLKLPSIQHNTDVDVAYYLLVVEAKTTPRPTLQVDFDKRVQEYLK